MIVIEAKPVQTASGEELQGCAADRNEPHSCSVGCKPPS
jgi:hypothetical protein